jgi:hypothetical protein
MEGPAGFNLCDKMKRSALRSRNATLKKLYLQKETLRFLWNIYGIKFKSYFTTS